jgi:hypothetical protein
MELRNGSYIQTIAEILDEFIQENKNNNSIEEIKQHLQQIKENNPSDKLEEIKNYLQQNNQSSSIEEIKEFINTLSGNTISSNIIVNSIQYLPQESITIVTDSKIPSKPIYSVSFEKKYIKPQPKIIYITNVDLKLRFCGMSSSDSKYVECSKCIDNQILKNYNSTIDDCKHCKDIYNNSNNNKCIGGQMIMGKCYCNK